MKAVLALLFLAILNVTSFAQEAGHTAAILDSFGDLMSKGNMTKIDGLFEDKATVYWIDKKVYGKPNLLKFLRRQADAVEKYEISFSPDDGVEDSKISTSWGTFAINTSTPGGQVSNQILGRYTVVAKNVDDKWIILSLHLSSQRFSD